MTDREAELKNLLLEVFKDKDKVEIFYGGILDMLRINHRNAFEEWKNHFDEITYEVERRIIKKLEK